MNNNKIIRKILIIFILIIIGILAPNFVKADSDRDITIYPTNVTYDEKFYAWGENSENPWGTGESDWVLIDTVTDDDTDVVYGASNDENTDTDIYLSFDEISEAYYIFCCNDDLPMNAQEYLDYIGQKAWFTLSDTIIGNALESYQLALLESISSDDYALDGANQYAWYNSYTGKYLFGGTGDWGIWNIGESFSDYICEVMGWSSDQGYYNYAQYSGLYKQYTITDENGESYTVWAPDLESVLEDAVKFSGDIDLDEDGETQDDGDEYDQVTVTYDSSDNAYKIGPFMLEYLEYYEYQVGGTEERESSGVTEADAITSWNNLSQGGTVHKAQDQASYVDTYMEHFGGSGGTYVVDDKYAEVWAAIIGCYLETNLSSASGETLEFGEDYWFEYLDDDGESSVTGMPGSERVFYLCIKYEEGLTSIENFCFDYAYQNAGSETLTYTGTMYYCSNCGSTDGGTWYDYEKITNYILGDCTQANVDEYNDLIDEDFDSSGYSVNSSLYFSWANGSYYTRKYESLSWRGGSMLASRARL